MADHIEFMQHLFKRREVELSKQYKDENSNTENKEFIDLDEVELWNIPLVSMTNNVNFITKFHVTSQTLLVFANELVKDVVHYKENILYII